MLLQLDLVDKRYPSKAVYIQEEEEEEERKKERKKESKKESKKERKKIYV